MADDFRRWICDACGFIYDEAQGDPDSGLAPGTRYEQIPDDWQCPLCGMAKSDLRLLPDVQEASSQPAPGARTRDDRSHGSSDHVVIIGAGIAGWSVAEAIRAGDATTPVMIVTTCDGAAYPKPALSTAMAQGRRAADLPDADGASKAASLDVDLRARTRILKIDPLKKRITTASGGIRYGTLVIATGASQRQLSIGGAACDEVLRVNDLATYRRLRDKLDPAAQHVTILGAGLIGCEFAEDLTTAGHQVSVVDPGEFPLASLLPAQTGRALQSVLSAKGTRWHFQRTLDVIDYSGDRLRVTLSDGESFETDLVLSAAGLVPNTQLADRAGVQVGDGIITDRLMHTSHDGIVAIGDCAAVEGRVFSYIEPIRRQAQTIAAGLRGEHLPFDVKPPLVRVKTPSFPVVVCPPPGDVHREPLPADGDDSRFDYRVDDRTVGFVLSGAHADRGMSLYRELFG